MPQKFREAVDKGIEAVLTLMENLESKTFYDVTIRRIEIAPEARESFSAATPGT